MGLPFSRATNYYSTQAEATATKRLLKEQQIMPMDVHKAEVGTVYVCIPVGSDSVGVRRLPLSVPLKQFAPYFPVPQILAVSQLA